MPKAYYDRFGSKTSHRVDLVSVDPVQISIHDGQDPDQESLPRQIRVIRGRVLGTQNRYSFAELVGNVNRMTVAELRALAESLNMAADVLEGKVKVEGE